MAGLVPAIPIPHSALNAPRSPDKPGTQQDFFALKENILDSVTLLG